MGIIVASRRATTAPLIVLPRSFMATPLAWGHWTPAAGRPWIREASAIVMCRPSPRADPRTHRTRGRGRWARTGRSATFPRPLFALVTIVRPVAFKIEAGLLCAWGSNFSNFPGHPGSGESLWVIVRGARTKQLSDAHRRDAPRPFSNLGSCQRAPPNT